MVILQALILYGHKVPDMKLNTSPETILRGFHSLDRRKHFLLGCFLKKLEVVKGIRLAQCLRFCEIEENVQ